MSLASQLLWTGIGLLVGALAVRWRPWERTPPPMYYAPLDPTPPTTGELTDGM